MLGVFATIVGFVLLAIIVVRTLLNGAVEGWTSMMAAILIMSGMQMLMLGMLGEYVGRIFINGNNSPQFIIKEKYTKESED